MDNEALERVRKGRNLQPLSCATLALTRSDRYSPLCAREREGVIHFSRLSFPKICHLIPAAAAAITAAAAIVKEALQKLDQCQTERTLSFKDESHENTQFSPLYALALFLYL